MNVPKPRGVLGPTELSVVTAAYELALGEISETEHLDIPAYEVRRRLAAAVMAEARGGTIDPQLLKQAGLDALLEAGGRSRTR